MKNALYLLQRRAESKGKEQSSLLSGLGVYTYAVISQEGNLSASFPRYVYEKPQIGFMEDLYEKIKGTAG